MQSPIDIQEQERMSVQIPGLAAEVAVVTGGGGVLWRALAGSLAGQGVLLAILDIGLEAAQAIAESIHASGGRAIAVQCDVLDRASVEVAAGAVLAEYGKIDILVNGAGGNKPQATADAQHSFFDMPVEALRWVYEPNFMGTLIPCQVVSRIMAEQGRGSILNISSMAALRPLTRTVAYSAAKAAVSNFTQWLAVHLQWLAVHLSQTYPARIRVNALAPGFFCTEQNRFLPYDQSTGDLSARGRSILDHTPMGRFGEPGDLVPAVLWLLSEGASFVLGAVIPIDDGGFSAFSGV